MSAQRGESGEPSHPTCGGGSPHRAQTTRSGPPQAHRRPTTVSRIERAQLRPRAPQQHHDRGHEDGDDARHRPGGEAHRGGRPRRQHGDQGGERIRHRSLHGASGRFGFGVAAEEAESKTPCLSGPAAGTQAPYAVCAAQREAQRKEAPAGAAAAAAGAAAEEQSEPEDLDGDLRAGKGVLGVAERWQRLLAMAGSHSALLTTGLRLRGTRRALTRVRPADVMGDQAYDREDEWIDDTDIHPASSNVQEERPATDGYFVNHGFLKTKRDDAYAARPRLPSASLTPPPPRRATAAPRTRPAATSTRTARRRRSSRRRRASGAHAAPRSPAGQRSLPPRTPAAGASLSRATPCPSPSSARRRSPWCSSYATQRRAVRGLQYPTSRRRHPLSPPLAAC